MILCRTCLFECLHTAKISKNESITRSDHFWREIIAELRLLYFFFPSSFGHVVIQRLYVLSFVDNCFVCVIFWLISQFDLHIYFKWQMEFKNFNKRSNLFASNNFVIFNCSSYSNFSRILSNDLDCFLGDLLG